MTTTHTTTDLGLQCFYTDQGKTPCRVKTHRIREKTLREEKNPNKWLQIGQYSTAKDMNGWNLNKGYISREFQKDGS